LKKQQSDTKGIQAFVQILQLHLDYDAAMVQTAITQALAEGMAHLSGVRFCLNRLLDPTPETTTLKQPLSPHLAQVGQTRLSIPQYDQLLQGVSR